MSRHRFVLGLSLLGASVPTLAHAGGALFAEDDEALENACGVSDGCWTNYVRVTDLDGDDDLDVLAVNYAGFFEPGSAEPLVVFTNDGAGAFMNTSADSVGGFEGRIRQVAVGDVDGDGDVDMYVPDANGGPDNLFINDGGAFTPTEIDIGSNAGAARFGDFDDDGDLDLFLADGYNTTQDVHGHVYANDGGGGFTEVAGAIPGSTQGNEPDDVDLLDADGDFDLDILLNNHMGTNELWINDGTGMFTGGTEGMPSFPGGNHYGPGVCDVDGDGDLDAWVDNMGPGYNEMLMINDGAGVFTDETSSRVTGNEEGDDDNGVMCVDADYDGDFDAVVIGLFTPERYLENDGDGNFAEVTGVFADAGLSELWGEFGDVNGDGRLDLVTGAGESGTQDRVFLGTSAQMMDGRAPGFRAVQSDVVATAGTDTIVHYAVTDNAVTDEGPRLRRAFVRYTIDGTAEEADAMFIGGDLFRAVIPGQPDGTSVDVEACAVDRETNEGCADAFTYVVGEAPSTGSGESSGEASDTDGSGSSDTDGTSAPTSGATVSDTNATGSATSGGSDTDTGGSGANEGGDGGGCGCREGGNAGWLALLLLALPIARRRR